MQLSKEQVNTILQNAPIGVDKTAILDGLIMRGYELEGVNTAEAKAQIQTKTQQGKEEPTYGQRVKETFKNEFNSAVNDINSNDSRTEFDKGISAISHVSNAIVSPITQAPIVKQIGEKISNAIQKGGDALSNLYTPEFKASLANLSDEEFRQATQPLQNLVNAGNIANNILLAKGGAKTAELATDMSRQTATKAVDLAQKGAEGIGNVADTIATTAKEVVPSIDRVVNEQVSKALELTPTDIKNIELSTGNVLGRFMADENLIGKNAKTTTKLLSDFFKTNYNAVRSEIEKVTDIYKPSEVPRFKQALNELKSQVQGVAGQESKLSEVNNLLGKKSVTLGDVQNVKELIDNLYSLYKNTGDVKAGVAKQGVSNIRSEIKSFIEQQVKEKTGADISQLNNKVATAKGILDAQKNRSTSGILKSNIKMGDLGIFGAGSFIGSPLFGLALLAGKKIIETPAMRFRVAKFLDGISDARKLKIQERMAKGDLPDEIAKIAEIDKNQYSVSKYENMDSNTRIKNTIDSNNTIPKEEMQVVKTGHKIRQVIENLSTAGYSTQTITKIIGKLFEKFPDGRFPPQEVANEVSKYKKPIKKLGGNSIIKIKK